jgi:hypothetical protein
LGQDPGFFGDVQRIVPATGVVRRGAPASPRVRLFIALTRRLLIKFETLDCVIPKSGMLVSN